MFGGQVDPAAVVTWLDIAGEIGNTFTKAQHAEQKCEFQGEIHFCPALKLLTNEHWLSCSSYSKLNGSEMCTVCENED